MKRVIGLVMLATLYGTALLGQGIIVPNWNHLSPEEIGLFEEVRTKIASDFYGKKPLDRKLFEAALKGMVNALGDKRSYFLSPEEYTFFFDKRMVFDTTGRFDGEIGIWVRHEGPFVRILKVEPGSPADKSGLKSEDRIYGIDSVSAHQLSDAEVSMAILGRPGSTVMLEVGRGESEETRIFSIQRIKRAEADEIPKTEWKIIEGEIVLIRVPNFSSLSSFTFGTAIREITELIRSPKFIIDFRDNLGGGLYEAGEIVSYWLDSSEVYCIAKAKDGETIYRAFPSDEEYPKLRGYRTVILVNELTASAPEILAGALQDHGYAKVIGRRTYGKGTMQRHFTLQDGYRLILTNAYWFTSNGRSINGVGIKPDVEIILFEEMPTDGRDPFVSAAVEVLKK